MTQHPYIVSLLFILIICFISWVVSLIKADVSIVDSLWSLFFLAASIVFVVFEQPLSSRGQLVFTLVIIWSLRLSIYLTIRNWRQPEDYRYQIIRANNQPNFALKSLYKIFGLQGALAWLVSLPLLPAITSDASLSWIDLVAVVLWLIGFTFEAVGDYQLSRFKSREQIGLKSSDKLVLNTGLWRYTRHPNYFGDFCIWWAFFLFAVASGNWWFALSPLLMSLLLLRVSGVTMLEKTITERRPDYAEYIRSTNAFFPGPRRIKD